MEEYTPKIYNGMTEREARTVLYGVVQELRLTLEEANTKTTEISPHLAWAVNKKLRKIESGIDEFELGIRMFFNEGELYG